MSLTEFDIIQRHFSKIDFGLAEILECGVGDDAAVLSLEKLSKFGHLHISVDTLCEGTHFLPDANPEDLGFKSLAVNVSDIFAMGAKPFAFTLCLTMPDARSVWVDSFANGLSKAAQYYGLSLIGGDTTRGTCSISIQIFGVSEHKGILRSGAKPGDIIVVTGSLGDAAAGLQFVLFPQLKETISSQLQPEMQFLINRCTRPSPHKGLKDFNFKGVNAAIDISDGLLPDLEHICRASQLLAEIDPTAIPLSTQIQSIDQSPLSKALIGGEDYELCMAISPDQFDSVQDEARSHGIKLSPIGHFKSIQENDNSMEDISWINVSGWSRKSVRILREQGFQHFMPEGIK